MAVKRIVVVGSSGSGKTTLGKRLADILGLPLLELDSVFHRGGWDHPVRCVEEEDEASGVAGR